MCPDPREGEAPTEPGRPSLSRIRGSARLRPSRAGHRFRGSAGGRGSDRAGQAIAFADPREGEAPTEPGRPSQLWPANGVDQGACWLVHLILSSLNPMEHIQFTLIRPILKSLDKSGSYRVLSDINPLFVVILTGAQSGIPMIRLPLLPNAVTRSAELRFPVSHPMIERDVQPPRGGEKVNVVQHQDIAPYQPRR
jgi:hypothetical protein